LFIVRGDEKFLYKTAESLGDTTNKEPTTYVPIQKIETPPKPQPKNPLVLVVRTVGSTSPVGAENTLQLEQRDGTIANLKQLISKQIIQVNPVDMTLIYQGKELENDKKISEVYTTEAEPQEEIDWKKVPQENVFVLVKPLLFYVKNLQGGTIVVDGHASEEKITHDSLVSKLKEKLRKKCDFNRLLFNQQVLVDGEKLSSYGVFSGCIMYMC
jgi:hypothetical protein